MLLLGVVAVILALLGAIGTWWGVMQSKDYHGGFMTMVLLPLSFVAIAGLNAYCIYQNLHDAHRCEALESQIKAHRKETQFVGGEAAMLSFFEARANELTARLEEMWHHYNAAGETLIYPVGGDKDLANDAAGRLINERRDFMVLYTHHLHWLSLELPKFESTTTINGYPSDKEYAEVLRNLKGHAESLGKLCDGAWHSGKSVFE